MSYFLCLSVPEDVVQALPRAFDPSVYLTEVSALPIGEVTRGEDTRWRSYLLQIGSSSASLVGKGSVRKTHNSDRSAVLVSGIQALLAMRACSSISFLLHWVRGHLATEEVTAKRQELLNATDLPLIVASLEEDVRYVVTGAVHVSDG
jgi:hypothetical protein